MRLSRTTAVFSSAVLWTASFPFAIYTPDLIPGSLSAVTIWLALIPVYLYLEGTSPKEHLKAGFLFGMLANLGVQFWISVALKKYGNLSFPVSAGILAVGAPILAVFPAVGLWLTSLAPERIPRWLRASVFLTTMFWIINFIPVGGTPWGSPGYALHSALVLIQVGDLFGLVGINFLIFLGSFVLAEALRHPDRRSTRIGVICFVSLFIGVLTYGAFRMRAVKEESADLPSIRVALLQGNISQDMKQSHIGPTDILATYRDLTTVASKAKPDLIVWPEAAFPFSVSSRTVAIPVLKDVGNGAPILLGAITWEKTKGKDLYRNSVFMLDEKGNVLLRHDKQHLVPFGEYVPLSDILPMEKIVPSVAGNFAAAATSGDLPRLKKGPFGILICYEILFPELAVDMVQRGARFFVNITNDAWFDETSGPYQHVNFGIFRAIETRRPIVRAANTGISTWFDSLGRSHKRTELFQGAILQAEIQPMDGLTFYVRHPYLLPWTVTLLSILFLLWPRKRSSDVA